MGKAENILLNVGMLILSVAILLLSIKMNRHIKEHKKAYETYQELIEQYDTTTTYNKLVIYPKIKDMEEKLK